MFKRNDCWDMAKKIMFELEFNLKLVFFFLYFDILLEKKKQVVTFGSRCSFVADVYIFPSN